MLDYRGNELIITKGLKAYLSKMNQRPCEVVRANQVAKIPPYPYVSYSVSTPANGHAGTYSQAEDGTLYRSILQTWSFTVQSDDLEESIALAYRMFDFFTAVGRTLLSDNQISVRRVGGISSRDNLITVQYEHRNGLDVTLGLLYTVTEDDDIGAGEIETAKIGESTIDKPMSEDELNELLERRLDGE